MHSEDIFNHTEREKNIVRSSLIGAISHVAQLIPTFVGRTIFLWVLTEEYLGITGLFTNLLLVLSLADLGIATAITFRFYEPVSRQDIVQIGKLMNFFKSVYTGIVIVLLTVGLAVTPFVKFMVNDVREIPADVNLHVVYLLFLADTVASYLFVYKQTLLAVDQRNDIVSLCQTGCVYAAAAAKIAVLLITRNYTAYLLSGIAMTILINYAVSLWVTRKYRPVFAVKEQLTEQEKWQIFSDTGACLLHKVGTTVLSGTDNLVLTKMIGLAATGLYSNYSIITANLTAVLAKLFGNYVSSIGNAKVKLEKGEHYSMYRKLRFLDWFMTSVSAVCLYVLLNDFISIWLGDHFLLDRFTVACLVAQYFLAVARVTNESYINACGLFVKDKPRPIIEAIMNLVISVPLAKYIGIAGVFLGTIISHSLTVGWREPYILYRYEFQRGQGGYWAEFITFILITGGLCFGIDELKIFFRLDINNWLLWLAEAVITALASTAVLSLVFWRKEGFRFLLQNAAALPGRMMQNK